MDELNYKCQDLVELRVSVLKFLNAYAYGMNKLAGWSETAYESFEPIIKPYVEELAYLADKGLSA